MYMNKIIKQYKQKYNYSVVNTKICSETPKTLVDSVFVSILKCYHYPGWSVGVMTLLLLRSVMIVMIHMLPSSRASSRAFSRETKCKNHIFFVPVTSSLLEY